MQWLGEWLYQINTGEILLPKELSIIALGPSDLGSGEGMRDFNFPARKCGCKTDLCFQGSVTSITVKLNKSYDFFLSVCTFKNYLNSTFLDSNAV